MYVCHDKHEICGTKLTKAKVLYQDVSYYWCVN